MFRSSLAKRTRQVCLCLGWQTTSASLLMPESPDQLCNPASYTVASFHSFPTIIHIPCDIVCLHIRSHFHALCVFTGNALIPSSKTNPNFCISLTPSCCFYHQQSHTLTSSSLPLPTHPQPQLHRTPSIHPQVLLDLPHLYHSPNPDPKLSLSPCPVAWCGESTHHR